MPISRNKYLSKYIFYSYWYSREPRLIQSLTLRIVLGKYLNDEFSDFLFCVMQNWFSDLFKFRGANSELNRKGSTGSPWHNVAIDIHKISPLDTPNQILIWSKILGHHAFHTLEHFCPTN